MKGYIIILLFTILYSCNYQKNILSTYDVNSKTKCIIKYCNDNKYTVSYTDGFTYSNSWKKINDSVLVFDGVNRINISGYDSIGLKSRILYAIDTDGHRYKQSSILVIVNGKTVEITPFPFKDYWIIEGEKNITEITIKTPCGQTKFFGVIPNNNVIKLKCNFSELTCIEKKRALNFDTVYLRKKIAIANNYQKLKYGK